MNCVLSAQNFHIYEGDGLDPFARTGAVSPEQLFRAGAEGVILGHSEVGDTPEQIRQKLLTLVGKNMLPKSTILVGESWEEFDGQSPQEIAAANAKHLQLILNGIPREYFHTLVVGYEPKWGSRGSGRDDMPPPSPDVIFAACQSMKEVLTNLGAESMPVIYGGRSTPERTVEILQDVNIEGLILGSACNTIKKTMDIADAMTSTRPSARKILHANFKAYELQESYEEYLEALRTLDQSFTVYISPPFTDIQKVRQLIDR